MIGNKLVPNNFVSFITQRLLDLSRAYETECLETLTFTDIPGSTLKSIGWFKFDRLNKLGYEYVRRRETEELIRLDAQLLHSITGEVAKTIPYSNPEAPGVICPVSHPPRAYQSNIYDCVNAIIASVITDMRLGKIDNKSVASVLGISPETVWSLAALHSDQCRRVAQLFAERVSYENFFLLDTRLLSNLAEHAMVSAKLEEKLEKYILLGASQRQIKFMLGKSIRNTTISEKKRYLKFTGRREYLKPLRHSTMSRSQRDDLYNVWIRYLHLSPIDRYIAVAEHTRINICAIHSVVNEIEPSIEDRCA